MRTLRGRGDREGTGTEGDTAGDTEGTPPAIPPLTDSPAPSRPSIPSRPSPFPRSRPSRRLGAPPRPAKSPPGPFCPLPVPSVPSRSPLSAPILTVPSGRSNRRSRLRPLPLRTDVTSGGAVWLRHFRCAQARKPSRRERGAAALWDHREEPGPPKASRVLQGPPGSSQVFRDFWERLQVHPGNASRSLPGSQGSPGFLQVLPKILPVLPHPSPSPPSQWGLQRGASKRPKVAILAQKKRILLK